MNDQKTGICPVCAGTKRVDANLQLYAHITRRSVCSGYDEASDTFECNNCGAQKMFGVASGTVRLRADGTPCTHSYESWNAGRCLTAHKCRHCGDTYSIDSSD
jgi:hypothetical protein